LLSEASGDVAVEKHDGSDAGRWLAKPIWKSARFEESATEETVTFMDKTPFLGFGLRPVELTDQASLVPFFKSLTHPLSDYTFSQIYTWRNSLRILWTILEGHLCVFANGGDDLTLLMPPIGDTASDKALDAAWDVMDAYNAAHGLNDRGRIEYASEELLGRFERDRLTLLPMGTDYIYDVSAMIELPGGDLASKRQAKNRFLRNYPHRVERYSPDRHLADCLTLLDSWKHHQDQHHLTEGGANAIKRQKESLACQLALRCAPDLGLRGMVIYVTVDGVESLRAFTFGEALTSLQSSIVIEKTDLEIKGLAQFIFSEFCREHWSAYPRVNVGDDWGLPTLAWTKMSYRPVALLQKYSLTRPAAVQSNSGFTSFIQPAPDESVATAAAAPLTAAPLTAEALALAPLTPAPLAAAPLTAEAPALAPLAPAPLAAEAPSIQIPAAEASAVEPTANVPPTDPTVIVRPARGEDISAAVMLEQACFSAYSISKRQLQYLRQSPNAIFIVAQCESRVIGTGIALLRRHKRGLSGRIYSLSVASEHRGRKVGRALMRRMIDDLASRGVRRIYLEVERSNAPAVALYEKIGFQRIGLLPDYYGQGGDGFHMMYQTAADAALLFDAHVTAA
jgi:hypothetical protein